MADAVKAPTPSVLTVMPRRPRRQPFEKFARKVREQVGDGLELIEFARDLMRGNIEGAGPRDRLEAAKFLAERGWGKAGTTVDIRGQFETTHTHVHAVVGMNLKQLSNDDLSALDTLLNKALPSGLPLPEEDIIDAEVEEPEVLTDSPSATPQFVNGG